MSSQYIIEVFQKNRSDEWQSKGPGKVNYDPETRRLQITNLDKTIVYGDAILDGDIVIKPNFNTKNITLQSRSTTEQVGFKFDHNSHSAFHNCLEALKDSIETELAQTTYSSGRLRYAGHIKDDAPNGYGDAFYDNSTNSIKYSGEWEDGKYDGTGTFYNPTGDISIQCNNIHQSVPNGKCTITLSMNRSSPIVRSFKYNEVYDSIPDLKTNSETFCSQIAKHLFPDLLEIQFVDLDLEMRQVVLLKQLTDLQSEVKEIRRQNELMILRTSPPQGGLFGFLYWLFMG